MRKFDNGLGNFLFLGFLFFLGLTLGGVVTGISGPPTLVFGLISASTCFWRNQTARLLAQRLILLAGLPAAFMINYLSSSAPASNPALWAVNLPQARIVVIIGAVIGLITFAWQQERPQPK